MNAFLRCALALALPLASLAAAGAESSKPNVVVILSDDIGYGDLGCYGATVMKTPNLDRLAREGRRFTDAHSPASMCTPTRRALLTGTYSWRQSPGSSILSGNAQLCIPPGTPTLASFFKEAGYATAVVGKWHLGLGDRRESPDWNGEIKPGPLELGFDYAFLLPATGDRVPCVYVENRRVVGLDPADPIQVSYREKVGAEPTGRENPELLKLKSRLGHDSTIVNGIGRIGWMSGGKSARWVDETMADTFAEKAIAFLEKHAAEPFFLYLATHDIHAPQAPHARFYTDPNSGTRGAALLELDDTVGRVLAALERLGQAKNTLVIFSSDNGGVVQDGYDSVVNPEHQCNGALHGYKGSQFEGGHRVPFIARWPGHIPPGTTSEELIALNDLYATFAAILARPLPTEAALDSLNFLPALLGQPHPTPARQTFISHGAGTDGPFGIRDGDWKLVQNPGGGIGFAPVQKARPAQPPLLFNLRDDPAEKNNLAAKNPDQVERVLAVLARERQAGRTRNP